MGLIRLKVKVKQLSEEEMEASEGRDFGKMQWKDATYTYTEEAYRSEEIWKISSYSPAKTIVFFYEGEKVLVAEPFNDVFAKWEKAVNSESPAPDTTMQEVGEEDDEDE